MRRLSVFIGGVVLLCIVVIGGLHLIQGRMEQLNDKVLREVSQDNALLVEKEFRLLEQRATMLGELLGSGEVVLVDKIVQRDTQAYDWLVGYITIAGRDTVLHRFPKKDERMEDIWASYLQNTQTTVQHEGAGQYLLRQQAMGTDATLYWMVDLMQLNAYFWESTLSGRSYFELYSSDGICLIHPDTQRVGLSNREKLRSVSKIQDTVMLSSYLRTDVLVRAYPLEGFFGETKILVSVLLLMTSEQIDDISIWTLLLAGGLMGGTVIMLQLLYRERERIRALQLNQLQFEKERATMHLAKLREQVNPHFLFNSLGSLQQLIGKENEPARGFIRRLIQVYRKILQADGSGMSTLKQELELAESYTYLQTVRFGSKTFSLLVDGLPIDGQARIPHLSLQILVENAIKHNELSDDYPLQVHIQLYVEAVVVRNGIRSKQVPAGMKGQGYGLAYIESVYRAQGKEGFTVHADDGFFTVVLPFL